jgi:hypothetical protein
MEHVMYLARRWGGPPRMLVTLMVMLALVASVLGPTAGAVRAANDELPLDLPAMALTPSDLEAEGFAGFGRLSGESHVGPWLLGGLIGNLTYEMSDDEVRQTVRDAGLLRGYEFSLRQQGSHDDQVSDPVRDVFGTVYEFADDDGAADAFAFMADLAEVSETVQHVEGDAAIGDGTVLFRETRDQSDPLRMLILAFRTDRLIAVVQLWDYAGEEPAVAEVERLGARLLERIEDGVAGEAPGLGSRVLRLQNTEFDVLYEVRSDHYLRLDGEELPLDYEDAETVAARSEAAGDAIDVYGFNQFVQEVDAVDPSLPYQMGWSGTLYRFADDEAAADWLAGGLELIERETYGGEVTVQDLEELPDAPAFGDESVTVSYLAEYRDGYVAQAYRVQARFGAVVVDAMLAASAGVDLPFAAFEALAAYQAACDTADGCPAAILLSDALTGPSVADGAGSGADGSATGGGSTPPPGPAAARAARSARR